MNTDWREVKREGKRIGVADVDQRWEKRDSASQAGRAPVMPLRTSPNAGMCR